MHLMGVKKRYGIRTRNGLRRVAGKLCPYCQVEMTRGSRGANDLNAATRDHILALSRGGLDCVENIQMICRRCNEDKGSLLPEEFIAWRDGRASRIDRGENDRWYRRAVPYYVFVNREVGWAENPINIERRKLYGGG